MGAQKKVEGLVLSNLEKLPHVELDIMRNDEIGKSGLTIKSLKD